MRIAPPLAAFTIAAGLVGFSAAGQLPPDKAKKTDGDLVRLQGEWTITKVTTAGDDPAPPPDILKQIGVSVAGDRITFRPPPEGPRKEPPVVLRLVVDSTKAPRQVDLIPLDEKGAVRRRVVYSTGKGKNNTATDEGPYPPVQAIYKLDGDALVVCAPIAAYEQDARPAAFKALPPRNPKSYRSNDQGYAVVELARKK